MAEFRFRPHHFLCSLGFVGKGYSPEFVANFEQVVKRLRGVGGDDVQIFVESKADSICAPCPSRRGESCAEIQKIDRLDRAHSHALGWEEASEISWGEAKARIRSRLNLETFDEICAPCGWKSLGVCWSAVQKLQTLGLALVLIWGGAGQTWAAEAPSEYFTDQLRSQYLARFKSPQLKGFRQALDLKKKGKLSEAREKVQKLVSLPEYRDHALATLSKWDAEAGQLALDHGKSSEALRLFARAKENWIRLQAERADSAYTRDWAGELGRIELGLGRARIATGKTADGLRDLENAHLRIPKGLQATRFQPEALRVFYQKSDPSLHSWIERLFRAFPKVGKDYQLASEGLPLGLTPIAEKDPQVEEERRLWIPYRAPEKDMEILDSFIARALEGKSSDALDLGNEFLKNYPRSQHRFRVQYWMGRLLQKAGKTEDAGIFFDLVLRDASLTYYGILAAYASHKKVESRIDVSLPKVRVRDADLSPLEQRYLSRAERLLSNGLPELAGFELREIKARAELGSSFLTYLAWLNSESGQHLAAFGVISELLQRRYEGILTTLGLGLIFPTPLSEEIQSAANAVNLDGILALSLIKQESAFLPDAVSHVGATGLMQIMPTTAIDVDADLRLRDLPKPEVNLTLGTRYLMTLLKRFDGNIVYALGAYNAGPHRVQKWRKEARPEWGLEEFVESIPYKETREYVGAIIRNYYWYTYRFTGRRLPSLDAFWGVPGPSESPQTIPAATDR